MAFYIRESCNLEDPQATVLYGVLYIVFGMTQCVCIDNLYVDIVYMTIQGHRPQQYTQCRLVPITFPRLEKLNWNINFKQSMRSIPLSYSNRHLLKFISSFKQY